jgi:hypothetical protein
MRTLAMLNSEHHRRPNIGAVLSLALNRNQARALSTRAGHSFDKNMGRRWYEYNGKD